MTRPPMNIAVLASGSRGDVQPYAALARGLQAAGHAVRLIAPEPFAALAREAGVAFWPLRGDLQAVLDSPELHALLERGNFLAINRYTARFAEEGAVQRAEDGLRAAQGMDLLITGLGGLFGALGLAEKLDIPLVQAHVFPFTPTAAFPGVLVPPGVGRLGGLANRLSHGLLRRMMWLGVRRADTLARTQVLGLPPLPARGPYRSARLKQFPALYGFSPAVIAPPPDWAGRAVVTGFWFLDPAPDWAPPPDLVAFLDAGPAPVYVGFGSMGSRDPQATAALVLGALRRVGQRAVLPAGWSDLTDGGEDIYFAPALPHAWLLPRMAATVHHGGAGTTAAALRAGVPNTVVPFFGDQPFWGSRVAALGAGPRPIPRRGLSEEGLVAALRAMLSDTGMRERAAALGERVRAEDGVADAVQMIERLTGR